MKATRSLFFLFFLVVGLSARGDDSQALQWYEALQDRQPETKEGLTPAELKQIFDGVSSHPVTRLDNLAQYDPNGYVGFCFGRAMAVHLMARRMGLRKESIAKLFILGDLRSGPDPEWRFHVTTILRGADGQWHAVDPILTAPLAPGGPVEAREWIRIVKGVWDKPNQAKLYVTSAETVMPDVIADPNGTTGHHIIELGFKPETKAGFTADKIGKYDVWVLDARAEETYMTSVREPESDRFRFHGIHIGADFIDYRNYFVKLLGDLSGEAPLPKALAAALAVSAEIETQAKASPCPRAFRALGSPRRLFSPRLDRFFGGSR